MGTGAGLGGSWGLLAGRRTGWGRGSAGFGAGAVFLRAGREKPRGRSGEGGMLWPGGAQPGPGGGRHGPGSGWGVREAAESELPLTRVFLVPAEWVWPGLTSRSSRLPT